MSLRLTFALLACAAPALAQGQNFAPGTRLICRLDSAATGLHLDFAGPGVYSDQTGSQGGYVWDHRGFDFISGPFAGVPAEAMPGVIRMTPSERGRTLVCSR